MPLFIQFYLLSFIMNHEVTPDYTLGIWSHVGWRPGALRAERKEVLMKETPVTTDIHHSQPMDSPTMCLYFSFPSHLWLTTMIQTYFLNLILGLCIGKNLAIRYCAAHLLYPVCFFRHDIYFKLNLNQKVSFTSFNLEFNNPLKMCTKSTLVEIDCL